MQRLKNVSEYIAKAPQPAQPMLRQIRRIIKSAAPKAKERISYGMPFYEYKSPGYKGRLAYFAAFRDHVSYFAMPGRATQKTFAKQIKPYRTGKATLQFPLGSKLPVNLLKKLVRARMKEIDATLA